MSKLRIVEITQDGRHMVVIHREKRKYIERDVLEDVLNDIEWTTIPLRGKGNSRERVSRLKPGFTKR